MEQAETLPTQTPRLLLIIDDHADTRDLLTQVVADGFPAWQVFTAESGEAGLQLAATHQPEIALVDINLGGMNGFDATRRLLQLQPSLFVIVMSLQYTAPYREEALAAGAVGFLDKRSASSQLVPLLGKACALLR